MILNASQRGGAMQLGAHLLGAHLLKSENEHAAAGQARDKEMAPLNERRLAMKDAHAVERQRLDDGQRTRASGEAKVLAARLRRGVMGLWDRMTGQHGQTIKQNETEAFAAFRRDRGQRDALVSGQLDERRDLQRDILAVRHRHAAAVLELHRDLARQDRAHEAREDGLVKEFGRAANMGAVRRRSAPDTARASMTTRSARANGTAFMSHSARLRGCRPRTVARSMGRWCWWTSTLPTLSAAAACRSRRRTGFGKG